MQPFDARDCSYFPLVPERLGCAGVRGQVRSPDEPLSGPVVQTFCPRLASSGLDKKLDQAASNARLTFAPLKKVGLVGWLLCSPLPVLGGAFLFLLYPDIAAS